MSVVSYDFPILVGLLQCFGIASLVLVGVWMGKYRGGFAWDGSDLQFNCHPVCMVSSMVFLTSEAMIIYRVLSNQRKAIVKLLHLAIQCVAFIVAVIGLSAVFDYNNRNHFPNMYSLHSWLGITTVVLFTCQLVCGFLAFLFPKLPDAPRALFLKIHVFFGATIFLLAIGTCLAGITGEALFSIASTYNDLPAEGVLINIFGIVLLIVSGLAFLIIMNPRYKRVVAAADEEHTKLMGDVLETEK